MTQDWRLTLDIAIGVVIAGLILFLLLAGARLALHLGDDDLGVTATVGNFMLLVGVAAAGLIVYLIH